MGQTSGKNMNLLALGKIQENRGGGKCRTPRGACIMQELSRYVNRKKKVGPWARRGKS